MPFDQVKSVTFKGDYKRSYKEETFRNRMKLKLAWAGGKPEKTASIGMVYLQEGIRWVPNYKITIDGKGNATVKLQATLINEMIDLQDVTAYLVIGVPSFPFKDMVDPMSLQQTFPELTRYFQPEAQTGYAFSNAMMGQGFGGQMTREQIEMMRLLNGLKVEHKLRLNNGSAYPLTTAPALILNANRVVAQGVVTYTAVSAKSDLTLTTAVQVSAKTSEQETERIPNSLRISRYVYQKVQMAGKVTLSNRTDKPIELEVTRYVDGQIDTVSEPGEKTMVNPDDDPQFIDYHNLYNYYYNYVRYNAANGVGRFFWKVKIPARESVDLAYTWHFFTN